MAARRFAAKHGLLDAAAVVPYLYTQTLVSVDALAPEAVHPPDGRARSGLWGQDRNRTTQSHTVMRHKSTTRFDATQESGFFATEDPTPGIELT